MRCVFFRVTAKFWPLALILKVLVSTPSMWNVFFFFFLKTQKKGSEVLSLSVSGIPHR